MSKELNYLNLADWKKKLYITANQSVVECVDWFVELSKPARNIY